LPGLTYTPRHDTLGGKPLDAINLTNPPLRLGRPQEAPLEPPTAGSPERGPDRLDRLPGAELAWAGPISGELASRICCDAVITRVITDGASQPLDVGRQTRVVPAGMRRALLVRDRHCQYPGCDTPGQWCDAHHLDHWALGGVTKLANLVLLCPYHHTRLHLSGHWLRRRHEGTIELITDDLPDHHTDPPGGT